MTPNGDCAHCYTLHAFSFGIVMSRFAAGLHRFTRLLLAFAIAAAVPAWSAELPVVKGEAVVGSPKSAEVTWLLTTEDEMPARPVRLAAPFERELRAFDAVDSQAKRARVGIGREMAGNAVEGTGDGIVWSRVGEWRIAKLRVQSPGAVAIRVGLRIGATRQP
ncbi:MAG TPA: hypothetical protein VFV55_05695, partial [Usitatibacteraceae bacterium]|nr:hypothetical protein [Usitatibacteraceae bacterium]